VKLIKTLGVWVVVIVLLLLWHRYLVSSRSPKLKEWELCKAKRLGEWAASHPDTADALRELAKFHFHSFAAASSANHFDDHDSLGTAVSDAAKLGISEAELVHVDQQIAEQCGSFST